MFELLTFAPGEVIIQEGVVDQHLYILQAGTVEVRKAGTEISIIEGHGTFIGEISAILEEPRSCTVVARTECDLLRLAQSVDEMIRDNPIITRRLLEEMARRISRATDDLIEAQHTLITFKGQQGFPAPSR